MGMTEALNVELNEKQRNSPIKSTVVCPSIIDTGLFKGDTNL